MANEKTNSDRQKFLNPPKPVDCLRAMMRGGMSRDQASKHCNSLWKKEESRREGSRTVRA